MAVPANVPFAADASVAPTSVAPAGGRAGADRRIALPWAAWIARILPAARKAGRAIGFALFLIVFFVLVIAICAELGWFIGWASGEVTKTVVTRDFSAHDIGADFGTAWGGQLAALGGLASAIGQRL